MRTRLAGLAAIAALVTSGLTGSALAGPADRPEPGSRANAVAQDARADEAKAALADVAAIFAGTPAGSARAAKTRAHGRDATMALRNLAFLKGSLSGSDRAAADRFLSRPTQGVGDPQGDGYSVAEATPVCGPDVCIHYVATTVDAPPMTDTTPANGIPDYVEFARDTFATVHTSYVAAGYKEPKDDTTSSSTGGNGGSGLTDIYLVDIGDDGLYGYCTTDDPAASIPGNYDVSAYCVLDDDYVASQFPSNTPAENFQVTAAHEYFHAVQYAYDALEDRWFMEASATWAEDELFDSVDDNLFYLDEGQLKKPYIPLDLFGSGDEGLFHYGNWIFFRYLTEKYPAETGGMPTLMLDLWNKVDAAEPSDPDNYGIQAIKAILGAKSTSFTKQYALFADAGRRRSAFSEGVANSYPIKPLGGSMTLSTGTKSTGWLQVTGGQDHMTSLTLRVAPNSSLNAAAWRLRVELDLAATSKGTAAVVTVYKQSGGQTVTTVPLNDQGNKSMAFKFGRTDVKYVEITMVNASTRFDCWVPPYDSPYSCLGNPKDENLRALVRATAFR